MIPKSHELYAFIGRDFLNPGVNKIEEIDGLRLLISEIRDLRQRDIDLGLDNLVVIGGMYHFKRIERCTQRVEGRSGRSIVIYPLERWVYARLTCGLYACIPTYTRTTWAGDREVPFKDYGFFLDVSKFPYLPRPEGTKYLGFDIATFHDMEDMGDYAEQMDVLVKYLGHRDI